MEKVISKRNIYTPSKFAKDSLIYLQEVGESKTLEKNTNSRKSLDSFLFFIVLEGEGTFRYKKQEYVLNQGKCAFIDCNEPHSHTSSDWKIAWVHFNGSNVKKIYNKYLERSGDTVFLTHNIHKYEDMINEIYNVSSSNDYLKDMHIFNKLSNLLTLIMSETIYFDDNKKKYDIEEIRNYLDNNYLNSISLDSLSNAFFINKFYLTRAFKAKYGKTINSYILEKRISKAKELLRYKDSSIEDIAKECGIEDQNYFSRLFKKIEGISPKDYKKMW